MTENFRGARANQDYILAAGLDNVPGSTVHAIQGSNGSLATSRQTLAPFLSGRYVYPSDAGEVMSIASDNAADVGVLIRVRGLDTDFLEKTEVVELAGTTPVALTGLWSRINELRNVGGSEHLGQVTVSNGGNTYSAAGPEEQRSLLGVYTVPADKVAQVLSVIGTMVRSGGTDANVVLYLSLRARPVGAAITDFAFGVQRQGDNSIEFINTAPSQIPGRTDIEISGEASATNNSVLARVGLLLTEVR
jgi:hypothetical protein